MLRSEVLRFRMKEKMKAVKVKMAKMMNSHISGSEGDCI